MNNTTSRRRRYSARAAAVATTAAVIFGAAACGSETVSDNGKAAPAAALAEVQAVPHTSADSAERRAATERGAATELQDGYVRHLLYVAKNRDQAKYRRQSKFAPGHWRDIPLN
jgi:hypothetical protein